MILPNSKMGCCRFTQLLTLFCLVSSGRLIRGTQVKLSYELINFMNFTCSDASPDDDTFSYMQIVQFTAQGNETLQTVQATLKDGRATPSPDILEVMGKRSLKITGDVRKNIRWLEIVVYDYALDLHMRIYGEFTCSVGYDGQEKRMIGQNVLIVPGVSLQAQNDGFMVRMSRAVDLICWATLSTLAGTLEFTLNIVRMADKTLVASWRQNKIPTCPPTPKAMCSNLFYIKDVVYAKVRLFEESDLGKDFKCNVETEEGQFESNVIHTGQVQVYVVVLVGIFTVVVFSIVSCVIAVECRKFLDFIRNRN